ncbi:tetratricopeptide repeat protein [Portibacter marinus]|uniref:tetratricopeptide repeat protein n=1 Tax=Portibacter marinus TaxID=2898660 RepID=UPI001F23F9C3|nr:tetratricopeptide repeat protein [Portibacter marinus]
MYRSIAIVFLLFLWSFSSGQITASYTDANIHFKKGKAHFDNQLYGLAKEEFQQAAVISLELYDEKSALLAAEAKLMAAKASVYGGFPEGEKEIMDYFFEHRPAPLAYEAARIIGDLKYDQKRHSEVVEYYDLIELDKLPEEIKNEVLFKKGYSHFILKEFEEAESNFESILGKDTKYYFQAYYYMAMIQFFYGNYDQAIEYFFLLENYPEYKSRIPYYIAQIYFEQKNYDDLLNYIPQQLDNPDVENRKELRHILGQTLFLRGDYANALPHLEFYESQSRKMRKEDFYQLAFSQYQVGQFEKAAVNFLELSNLDSEMGQISNNYLADAYLKLGNKEDARISFKNVMNFSYFPDLKQEATFNYGKLSAELGYDRAAINTLIDIPPTAKHYTEAQKVLGNLFESSKDYSMVIATIENMQQKAPEVLKAYQKVILERGIQLINDGNISLALQTLKKAAQTPVDNYYTAIILFHLGDLLHQQLNYDESIKYLNQYFTLAEMTGSLPASASPVLAHYLQGYNHLKTKDYTNALDQFTKSKMLMNQQNFRASPEIRLRRIYADALNRIADAYFTVNDYAKASEHYKLASQINFPGQDYAFFQLGMIKGLQGQPYEKIVLMEELLEKTPNSSFKDDAYFQIGETQLALNQPRAAEIAYSKIIQLDRKSPLITRALLKLGLIAYNKGETQKAIDYYTNLFDNNPSKTEAQEALIALQEIYIQDLGRADDFAELVEKATGYKMSSLERDSLTYIAAQGKFENGEYIEAIESYTKYIDNFPTGINRLNAIYNRAESKTILKQYAEALPDYDVVIKAGPSEYYEDAILKAALITYNDLKRFEESFNYYSLLSEVTSDQLKKYEAQLGAMRSAYRFGDPEASLAYTSKVILNPLVSKEDKALAHFYAGKMHYLKENLDAASQNFEQVVLLVDNENSAEAKYLRNEIVFKKGDLEAAEDITMESISNSTAYPFWVAKNLLLLADITIGLGDLFNAKAAVEAVIENFPESEELQSEAASKLEMILAREADETRIEDNKTINLDTIKENE